MRLKFPFRSIKFRNTHKIILLCAFITLCMSTEQGAREIYLQPQNFNPHPYLADYKARFRGNDNVGPVLFPETPSDPDNLNENYEKINSDRDNRLSVDSPSYMTIVRKTKYKQNRGFESNQKKKDYAFSYKVQDYDSGDDYSHIQQQNSKATNGEYRVKLPDGRLQIVSYTADKNGYKADVKYAENVDHHRSHFSPHSKQEKHVQQTHANFKPELYGYFYDDSIRNVDGSNSHNTQQEFLQDNYETPQRYPHQELIQYKINPNLVLNVIGQDQHQLTKINEHGPSSNNVGQFIASTLAPYILDSSEGFQQNVLSSFSSDETSFSRVQANTPSFQLLDRQTTQHLIYQK